MSTKDIVIALDPGFSTGLVIARITGKRLFDVEFAQEIAWEDRFDAIHAQLSRYCQVATCVVEDFKLYKHAAQSQINSSFPSARVIGVIDAYCHDLGIPVVMQMSSVRQNVMLLESHLHMIAFSEHAQDAYRHARYYILTHSR